MPERSDPCWDAIQMQLSALLDTLDDRDETLIAAHVAMALDCVEVRQRGGHAQPS